MGQAASPLELSFDPMERGLDCPPTISILNLLTYPTVLVSCLQPSPHERCLYDRSWTLLVFTCQSYATSSFYLIGHISPHSITAIPRNASLRSPPRSLADRTCYASPILRPQHSRWLSSAILSSLCVRRQRSHMCPLVGGHLFWYLSALRQSFRRS